jgi:hypothetical protein
MLQWRKAKGNARSGVRKARPRTVERPEPYAPARFLLLRVLLAFEGLPRTSVNKGKEEGPGREYGPGLSLSANEFLLAWLASSERLRSLSPTQHLQHILRGGPTYPLNELDLELS